MARAHRIRLTPTAQTMVSAIKDRRIQEAILDRMGGLAHDPDKQGKPLLGELKGLRSVRAVGHRYRIIYRIRREQIEVLVVAAGIRREGDRQDIYRLAQRLLRLGLLD
jgi:mRNA interferase RelE/StbE